mmetsp:Transcript_2495/g.5594  ORF Transcript_2495/g.5594 Transcript_2495/m.5594 type:complete len:282 (+) Transcript_2495:581-1426(+)
MLLEGHRLEFSKKQTGDGEVESKNHTKVRRPMIQTGSEIPLPHGTTRRSHHRSLSEKRIVHYLEESEVTIPNQINNNTQYHKLDADPPLGVIVLLSDPHHDVNHEKIVGVQETDVVQNKGCSLRQTQEQNQEIQSPKHLQDADNPVVGLHVKERKISKAGHPDVAGDHDSNRVVDLFSVVIVVEQEHKLHPPLPFFGLVPVENLCLGVRWGKSIRRAVNLVGDVLLPGKRGHHKQEEGQEEEKIGVVVLVRVLVRRMVLAHVGVKEDQSENGGMKQEGVDR